MFLSIIVPVYNIEQYIGRCLDSILQSCIEDCEILLVTGNSSDKTNEICGEYQKNYPNIKVLRQSGTGLSNARNCAFDAVSGTYIAYVDGDDYVDGVLFRELIDMLRSTDEEIDLVMTDFRRITSDGKRVEKIYQIGNRTSPLKGIDFLAQVIKKKQCFWNVWRFIYRRSFLEKNGIQFLENSLSEDIDYTTRVLIANPKVIFIHCPFYYYNVGRGDSLMDIPTYKRLRDTVDVLCLSIGIVKDSSFLYSQLLIGQYQFEYILNMAITCEVAEKDRKMARRLYSDTLDILRVGTDRLPYFVRGLLYVVPFPLVAELLHILKLCKRFIKRGPQRIEIGGNR